MLVNKYLSIKNLDVFYSLKKQQQKVLNSVNLTLNQGEIGVIIGPSGCGKSTLLHTIAGLHDNYQGELLIEGQSAITDVNTALILQDYGLLPWKSNWDNIMLGLKINNIPQQDAEQRIKKVLQQLGISSLANRYPSQLSGGQRQRVAIARSLVLRPKLLLMDEPFSSLDALTREEMQNLLLKIWKESRLTILLVTHSIEEAVFLGRDIFVMSSCPAKITHHINNPLAEDEQLRGKIQFLEMVNDLRSLLNGGEVDEL